MSLKIPVSGLVKTNEPDKMDEILSEEFEHVLSQLDSHVVWEIKMLTDFHTVGMSKQARYRFITAAIMDAIQNNGYWQLTSSFTQECAEAQCPCKITIIV